MLREGLVCPRIYGSSSRAPTMWKYSGKSSRRSPRLLGDEGLQLLQPASQLVLGDVRFFRASTI